MRRWHEVHCRPQWRTITIEVANAEVENGRPAAGLGRWSAWLVMAFVTGFGGLVLTIAAREKGGDSVTDNWWLAGPALVAPASRIGAFVTGLFAMVREEKRAPSATRAMVVGLLTHAVDRVGDCISPLGPEHPSLDRLDSVFALDGFAFTGDAAGDFA